MSNQAALLFKTIQESRQHLERLATLCDAELEAIKTRDLESLQQLVEEKQQLLLAFDQATRSRNELLNQAGFAADRAGLEAFIDQFPSQEQNALRQAWPKLEQALHQISDLNARNEQVVQRSKQNVDKLLSIVRGQGQSTKIYNQSGSAGHYVAQNIIGEA